MSRTVELIPEGKKLEPNEERTRCLSTYVYNEITWGLAARKPQEAVWREGRRQYEAIPRQQTRNTPIPNAPNIEVPMGAMYCDSIYAQAVDSLFAGSPLITVRPLDERSVDKAKAMQRWVNWMVDNEVELRNAVDHGFLDCIQAGTMVFYIPFTRSERKTDVLKIVKRGPRIYPIAPEDFLVRGGAEGNLQDEPWCAMRFWYTKGELEAQAKAHGWDITGVTPAGNKDWVAQHREYLGHTNSQPFKNELYEVWLVFCHYDYDEDGIEEELMVYMDYSSQKILKVEYNPYDWRPFTAARYQIRPHLFWGIGVMEMSRPYQEEATELHNHRTLNVMLANCRMWFSPHGGLDESTVIWPNRVKQVPDPSQIVEKKLSDVYPSSTIAIQDVMQLGERRVGVSGDLSSQAPSSRMLGTRTPGITAMSMLQQVNKRFTPAFDAMRMACTDAVVQALYRYQERLLKGDKKAEEHINKVLGDVDGLLVIDLLKDKDFTNNVTVEFTAASPSVNREADRQNAILLFNILGQYYSKAMEMVALAANPQTPPEIAMAAKQIADRVNELIERTLRTFDQVRDPRGLTLDLGPLLDKLSAASPPADMMAALQMQQMLMAAQPQGAEVPGETGFGVA